MIFRIGFMLAIVLGLGSGCVLAPTPLTAPTSIPSATAALETPPRGLPTPLGNRYAPADVPACQDAQVLPDPIQFAWAGIEEIVATAPETNWTYYRCNQSPAALTAFYRRWMPEAQYHWAQIRWEQQDATTLGVYFTNTGNPADPNRWLYLWFLPDESGPQRSYLAAAWWIAPKSC